MKKNIMWLVLMLMGAMLNVYAGENNPVNALLSSRDGYLWELTGWTQGSQAS